jgi:RNA polymerase sigma-70 factor, ECF subfamily
LSARRKGSYPLGSIKNNEGVSVLGAALTLNDPGPYQIQAAISSIHAKAQTAEMTDWVQIATLYGTLAAMTPSMVVEVNRAVAVAMANGAQEGLQVLMRLEGQAEDFYPYHAARADLLRRMDQPEPGSEAYTKALALCSNSAERAYLQRRLTEMKKLAG